MVCLLARNSLGLPLLHADTSTPPNSRKPHGPHGRVLDQTHQHRGPQRLAFLHRLLQRLGMISSQAPEPQSNSFRNHLLQPTRLRALLITQLYHDGENR